MNESIKQSPAVSSSLVLKIRPRSELNGVFSAWHAKMTTAPTEAPGFISTEVNAPATPGSNEWTVAQHFRTPGQMNKWRSSERCRALLEEAKAFADPEDPRGLSEETAADGTSSSMVTEVVTTYVKPGRDHEYQLWAEKVHSAEAQFPGYRGGFLQPPINEKQHYWTTLVRFATPEQLDAWLNSKLRHNLLREHEELVSSWEQHRLPNSFAAWFPTDAVSGESPASWKQSMLVLLMLFPIVMLEMKFLNPLLRGLNLAQGMFIGNVISVFALAWPFMPLIILVMNWWLLPAKGAPKWITPAGVALLLALYIAEIMVFALPF